LKLIVRIGVSLNDKYIPIVTQINSILHQQ